MPNHILYDVCHFHAWKFHIFIFMHAIFMLRFFHAWNFSYLLENIIMYKVYQSRQERFIPFLNFRLHTCATGLLISIACHITVSQIVSHNSARQEYIYMVFISNISYKTKYRKTNEKITSFYIEKQLFLIWMTVLKSCIKENHRCSKDLILLAIIHFSFIILKSFNKHFFTSTIVIS